MFRYIGIDVSKDTLDAGFIEDSREHHRVFSNTEIGYQQLLTWARKRGVTPVFCMEATGAYSVDVAEFLHSRRERVYVQNPRLIKAFRDSENERNSTDKRTSFSIARYAKAHFDNLREWKPLPEHVKQLRELIRMRRCLVETKTEWTNRRKSRSLATTAQVAENMLKHVIANIKSIERQIGQLVSRNASLKKDVKLLRSIRGIGQITACTILAECPFIREFESKYDLIAFAGLNPALRRSGTSIDLKPRLSKKGNSQLRQALYMPAIVATKHNQRIREVVENLRAKGKCPMSIIGAVMRRLLCYAFGVLRTGEPLWVAHQALSKSDAA